VGLRVADELLRAQAFCLPADPGIDLGQVLHWNRQTRIVRFACARNGDVWVHGDVPVKGLDESTLDRLLGLLAEGALAVRAYAAGLPEGSGSS
jgi:Putative bacterial sensory transduction regulator